MWLTGGFFILAIISYRFRAARLYARVSLRESKNGFSLCLMCSMGRNDFIYFQIIISYPNRWKGDKLNFAWLDNIKTHLPWVASRYSECTFQTHMRRRLQNPAGMYKYRYSTYSCVPNHKKKQRKNKYTLNNPTTVGSNSPVITRSGSLVYAVITVLYLQC